MVAAQAGGKTAGAEAGRAGWRKRRIVRLARTARRRRHAGIRSLDLAKARGTDWQAPTSPHFFAKAFPSICGMRPCKNPGRWIPRSAITSIPRSNTPMTGTRRAEFPAAANSAQVSMSRGWCRRSWANPQPRRQVPMQVPKMRRQRSPAEPTERQSVGRTAGRSPGAVPQTVRRTDGGDGTRFNGRWRCQRTRAGRRNPAGATCCAAATSATSWHRKTDCLDKSFCGHSQRLC